ncbi:uncharacterized protein Z520_10256 [Fonsecaea multimorphosa CBS 102226]|uniref:Oxidase FUB9 n=1 Tax=Fonsecaea multimorphosa CBS 102226 TaxID=1442371 RepID=A0A0D2JTZ8_9EURO|nr:uncharacterized protein Z520_10256 [Fonsecaea multimorphosa CBS 102226]KIX93919.1 hypothetical protein Z520_10256 [Fonsecaea multimorphosa CBS 102226]
MGHTSASFATVEPSDDLNAETLQPRRPADLESILTIADLRKLAQDKIPKMYRDYFNDGADDMITLRDNEAAYDRYKIRPRVLVNVEDLHSSLEMFGAPIPVPIGFAPSAAHRLAHPEGEVATSRAAARAGIPMGLSSWSTASIEDVASQGSGNPYIMHLTIMKNRERTIQTIRRIEKAGFKGVFITADTPVLGRRLNEYRNRFVLPAGVDFPNMRFVETSLEKEGVNKGAKGFLSVIHIERELGEAWDTVIPWLKSQTKLQIWVKGIYHPEDVKLAIKYGVDGVVISNHGGRQLDGVPASLDALRDCAPLAFDQHGRRLIQVAFDGGIRRGSDIFKAIALGAQMVFLGRIPLWGLCVGGEQGVVKALEILTQEFRQTMALAGFVSGLSLDDSSRLTVV